MIIEKDKNLKAKAKEDGGGHPRICGLCNKQIDKEDVEKGNFECVKNKNYCDNYYHSKCARKLVNKNARKRY